MNGADTATWRKQAAEPAPSVTLQGQQQGSGTVWVTQKGLRLGSLTQMPTEPGQLVSKQRLMKWSLNLYSFEVETNELGRLFIFTKKYVLKKTPSPLV